MSKREWLEAYEYLERELGRAPTEEEIINEIADRQDHIYREIRDRRDWEEE